MTRLFILALLLCAACTTPANAPSELIALGNVRNTATAEAVSTQAAAMPITESANERQFSQDQTATYSAPALRDTAQAQALVDATLTAVWVDATTTAASRATQDINARVVMSTAIPATGTALAVSARTELAEANSLEAWHRVLSVLVLALLVVAGIGVYWLFARAQANIKKANTAAENNKPQVFEDVLVYPSPTGGYIHQRLLRQPAPMPALASPQAIEERPIPINGNGAGTLRFSQPVNEHEKLWRECLAATLFHARERDSFASTELAGSGKLFSSNDHWQRVTDVLRDNDLILKDNGGKTVRAGEWTDIISRVQDATKPLKLPARIPPRLRVLEGQKVY